MNFDVLIKNGLLIDGTGKKGFCASLAIGGDRIVAVIPGKMVRPAKRAGGTAGVFAVAGAPDIAGASGLKSTRTVDATGKIICPGFIDIHSHGDLAVFSKDNPKIPQGVTAEVVGNCGLSVYPVSGAARSDWANRWQAIWGRKNTWGWETVADYVSAVKRRASVDVYPLAGYGSLRFYVAGMKQGLDIFEKKRIYRETERALDSGACGVSIGLAYPPCQFAGSEELTAVCRLLVKKSKYLSCHIRDEGDTVLESIEKVMGFVRKTGVRLQISHLKAYGSQNWHKTEKIVRLIESANISGYEVNFDFYPYIAGSTLLFALFPDWVHQMGWSSLKDPAIRQKIRQFYQREKFTNYGSCLGWDKVVVGGVKNKENKKYAGRSIAELSQQTGKDWIDIVSKIIVSEKGEVGMLLFGMNEKSLKEIMRSPYGILGSDGLYGRHPHPRTFGAFVRFLKKYCIDEGVLTLEEGIHRMTGMPARKLGLSRCGVIKEGYKANIVIFSPDRLRERASYTSPEETPRGIERVYVSGKMVYPRDCTG